MLLLTLMGCLTGGPEARAGDARQAMDAHFEDVGLARDAVLRGDLSAAHASASAVMGRIPVRELPARLRDREADLSRALRRLAGAPDLYAAGESLGEVANACAACHQQAGVKIPDGALSPSTGGAGVKAEMARHGYAAGRLWTGLVLPSEAAWQEGAAIFRAASLVPAGDPATSTLPQGAAELEVSVHDLAATAASATDATGRARAYGQMLATCAACHQLLNRGPSAP